MLFFVPLIVIASGCGGGDGSSQDAPAGPNGAGASGQSQEASGTAGSGAGEAQSALTRAEFVKQANAICAQGKKEILTEVVAYAKKHGAGPNLGNEAVLLEAMQAVFLPLVQGHIDELRALPPPEGDEQEVEVLLDSLQAAVAQASKATPSSNAEFTRSFRPAEKLAKAYGVGVCAFG